MKQLHAYKRPLVLGLISLCTVVGLAVTLPSSQAAAASCPKGETCCPDGEVSTSDGCCPISQEQVNGNIAVCGSSNGCTSSTDATTCLFSKYINPFVTFLAAAVGLAVVIGIIYGAIEYTTSGGEPARAASGKKHITNALIGLIAFFLLYAFLQFLLPGGILNGQ